MATRKLHLIIGGFPLWVAVSGLRVKGFAVDVDGTVTEDGGALNLDAAHSLRWLEKLGFKVILASGRGVWDTLALSIYLGATSMVVCENGGVVASSPEDIVLLTDKSESLKAYDYLSEKLEGLKLKPVFPRLTEVVLERSFDFEVATKLLEQAGLPIIINDSKYAYHLTDKCVDKAVGLKKALELLNLDPSGIVAVGDSDTDIPMFKLCGYSVALGNAPETAKAEARYCVKAGFGQGLMEAVQHVAEKLLKIGLRDEDHL